MDINNLPPIIEKEEYRAYAACSWEDLQFKLSDGCVSGDLNLVRYLFVSLKLPLQRPEYYEERVALYPLEIASNWRHFELVQYLLDCDEVKPANATVTHDAVLNAASNGYVHIMNYLLNHHSLKENSLKGQPFDLHANEDALFRYALEDGQYDSIEFLVVQMGLRKNSMIEQYLRETKEKELAQQIKLLFDTVEFHDDLQANITPKNKALRIKL